MKIKVVASDMHGKTPMMRVSYFFRAIFLYFADNFLPLVFLFNNYQLKLSTFLRYGFRIEKETKREIRRIDENLKVQLRSLKNLEQKLAKDPLPSYRSKKDSSISIDRSKLEMSSDNQYIN